MEDDKHYFRYFLTILLILILLGAMGYIYFIYPREPPYPDRTEWAYDMIEAVELHDDGYYGSDVIVAVIDTGIELTHPEFERYYSGEQEYIWLDLVNSEAEPYDDNGHGTAMAGLIAGKTYGISPEVSLIIVKTISDKGSGKISDIAYAIRFAVNNGADIISLSLGGGRFPIIGTDAERACQDAIEEGVFVVAAAGNDGENDNGDVDSPSNVELVISAGAVDDSGKIAPFSSIGNNDGVTSLPFDDRRNPNKKPEVVAPGVGIVVPWIGGDFGKSSGTSVSTVFVTGIIALTLEAHKNYQRESNRREVTIEAYKEVMMDTAFMPPAAPSTSHDDHYGYGIIQGAELNERL